MKTRYIIPLFLAAFAMAGCAEDEPMLPQTATEMPETD